MKRRRQAKHQIMHRHFFLRRTAVLAAVSTLSLLVNGPGHGPSCGGRPNARSAAGAVIDHAGRPPFGCVHGGDRSSPPRFSTSSHARLLVQPGPPIKIVALGSSSTYGVGASTSAASYPSRLVE